MYTDTFFKYYQTKLVTIVKRIAPVLTEIKRKGGSIKSYVRQFVNEGDSIVSPIFNKNIGKIFDLDELKDFKLQAGHRYALTFDAEPESNYYVQQGTGIMKAGQTVFHYRLYDVVINKEKNEVIFYIDVIDIKHEKGAEMVLPLIPIAVIVASLITGFVGYLGLKGLKTIKDITFSPIMIFLGITGIIMLIRFGVFSNINPLKKK